MLTRILATFDRVERRHIILLTEDGQEIRVAKEELEPLPPVGRRFVLQILPEEEAAMDQRQLATTLINQLLGNEEKAS